MTGRAVTGETVRSPKRLIRDDTKSGGWPDKCANCGAHWSMIGFDYALGFNCRKCGASDADE